MSERPNSRGRGGGEPPRPPEEPVSGRRAEIFNEGLRRAADRLDLSARRLDRLAEERLGGEGQRGRAGTVAHALAGGMGSAAGYLRDTEVVGVREGMERRIRERPLQSLLVGIAAGWIIGKVLR